MRADRLISILMLLQARGRLTAQALAHELEVSERTIYRDIDALSLAGVPVFCESGPGGGIGLLDEYRTSLTGLTEGEARALFAVSLSDALAPLGVQAELRSAQRKLAAALPAAQRSQALLHAEVHIDVTGWDEGEETSPYLTPLHAAIRSREQAAIRYRRIAGYLLEASVHPLGLASKAGAWHLVYARSGRLRVLPLAEIVEVRLTGEPFSPPAAFDLHAFWEEWCAAVEAQRHLYGVTVRASRGAQDALQQRFGAAIRRQLAEAPSTGDGWSELSLSFDSLESARAALLALGSSIEVLAPEPLRRSILDYAEQIAGRYRSHPIQLR